MKKIIAFVLTAALLLSGAAILIHANDVLREGDSLPGDANGDGTLDNKDVVVLFRYCSGNKEGAVEANCDYNQDGNIDNKDVVALFRALSGGSSGGEETTEEPVEERERYVFEELISLEKPEGYTFYENYLNTGFESGAKDGVPDGQCFFNFMLQDAYAPMEEKDTDAFLAVNKKNFNGAFGDYTFDDFDSYEVDDCIVTKLDWHWENGMAQSVVRIHFEGYCTIVINFAAWEACLDEVPVFDHMIETLKIVG